jgi:hypothetical protein
MKDCIYQHDPFSKEEKNDSIGLAVSLHSKKLLLTITLVALILCTLSGCLAQNSNRMSVDELVQNTERIKDSIQILKENNLKIYSLIDAFDNEQYADSVVKTKEKALLVKSLSMEFVSFSEDLMINIVEYTEQNSSMISDKKEIDFAALKRINNTTIPNEILLGKYDSGKAKILLFLIDDIKSLLSDIFANNPSGRDSINKVLDTRKSIPDNSDDQKSVSWETYYFAGKSEGEALLTLLNLQVSVKKAESIWISHLYETLVSFQQIDPQ